MTKNMNHETLLFDGPAYETVLLQRVKACTTEILISCYNIEPDTFSEKVFQALLHKASQGVKIKVVADGLGSWEWINAYADRYRGSSFEIRIYHPMTWKLLGISIKNIFRGLNRRNHHKLFIFDQKQALTGSRNINNHVLKWRETSILIEGPSVSTLCSLFSIIWQRSHDRLSKRYSYRKSREVYKKLKGSEHILSTHKFKLRRQRRKLLLRRITQAKREILITTPYFFPTQKVFKALLKKGRSDIKVSILLQRASDVVVSKWISQYHYSRLIKAGVHVFEYNKAILHAKSTLIDDQGLIGTSNMNRRSVYRDLEIDYIASQPSTVEKLHAQFKLDLTNSVQITTVPELGIAKKFVVLVATKVFSSWF